MKADEPPELAIFHTFKTKREQLTGEAKRQRSIITILASSSNPLENTRTAIAQNIAKKSNVPWKNIYSGIFRDFDEILIPLELVKEEGRLPLKRGPKALQEKGVPYYGLTKSGIVAALSIDSRIRDKILDGFLSNITKEETDVSIDMMRTLSETVPKLLYLIFENYVRGYCQNKIEELMPITIEGIKQTQGDHLTVYKELFDGYVSSSKTNKERLSKFLGIIT